ncbi:MAG: ATP-dependent DNA ligase, partial [Alphaproteobacteria bacterium]|nr:ATP-dependent DNA ligase [Alphaproteobacteria bacterium]
PGARKRALPEAPRPQVAGVAETPPPGSDWLHEIKFDGYRTLAVISAGAVRLLTRNGLDWTDRYGPIAPALAKLDCRAALIDGEVCAQDARGHTSLGALQEALADGPRHDLTYFCFDLLHLDGYDLTGAPLTRRKATLRGLLEGHVDERSVLQYSEHVAGNGAACFDEAARHGLEGIVSKRADAPYRPWRGTDWLKVKCVAADDFLIVGYGESAAAGGLSALLLADTAPQGLRYAGKVGTGFSQAEARRLVTTLKPLARAEPVFADLPKSERSGVTWVEPRLVAEMQYRGRTRPRRSRSSGSSTPPRSIRSTSTRAISWPRMVRWPRKPTVSSTTRCARSTRRRWRRWSSPRASARCC